MDESGQLTLDYLVGITIFLLALVFVFQYTTGLFTPFESSSDEVTMIADRVATTVVGDGIMLMMGNMGLTCSVVNSI